MVTPRLVRLVARLRVVAALGAATAPCACGDAAGSASTDTGPVAVDAGDVGDAGDTGDAGGVDIPLDVRGAGDVREEASADAAPACVTLGCPCASGADCASGQCVALGAEGARLCSEPCTDACSVDGFVCVLLENGGTDVVRLCVPETDPTCEPCTGAADCGSLRAACAPLDDGSFCLRGCDGATPCGPGFTCRRTPSVEFDVCVPDAGVCAACWDLDGDGWGLGVECAGADPDDGDATVYPGAPELCDGRDNDVDGVIDDVLPDARNACGGCAELADTPGSPCGPCGRDRVVCDGLDATRCDGETVGNACGGCATLASTPGEACGTCGSGAWTCDGAGGVVCTGDLGDAARNACGGCVPLDESPGTRCGACDTGIAFCAGPDVLACAGDAGPSVLNACGGCGRLDGAPGDACGTCGEGVLSCAGPSTLTCVGAPSDARLNACGGCAALPAELGAGCGRCGSGRWDCVTAESLTCVDEHPDLEPSCVRRGPLRFGWTGAVTSGATAPRFNGQPTTSAAAASSAWSALPFPAP